MLYSGFRRSAFFPDGEFRNSPTCRYVKNYPPNLSEEERVCGKSGVYNGETVVPTCENHREMYDLMQDATLSIQEDIRTFSLVRMNGVNLEEEIPIPYERFFPRKKIEEIPKVIPIAEECCVCDGKVDMLLTPCFHVVCYSCYKSLISLTCPQCRSSLENFIHRL